jgi:hypothetical protein
MDFEKEVKSDSDEYLNQTNRFVVKLSVMLSDPNLMKYVCWSDDGMSIVIPDSTSFEKEVLQTTKFSRWV